MHVCFIGSESQSVQPAPKGPQTVHAEEGKDAPSGTAKRYAEPKEEPPTVDASNFDEQVGAAAVVAQPGKTGGAWWGHHPEVVRTVLLR
jgi:hypothetical protein